MRREFPKSVKLAAWQRCNGNCEVCHARLFPGKFRFDHNKPDTFGGEPTLENCVVRCWNCDKDKTYKRDIPMVAKSNRVRAKHLGLKKTRNPLPGSRGSKWKRKMNGTVVPR